MKADLSFHVARRDYSLTGADAKAALAAGLGDVEWYRPPIAPERLQQLMTRRDRRPTLDALLWIVLIVGFATLAFETLGTWWAVPAFAAFGTLWGGSADARWHEHGHGTPFKTNWANGVVYYLSSFMCIREPTMWRWQHVRHHSSTQVVGLDPEITIKRPASFMMIVLNYCNLVNGPKMLVKLVGHAFGHREEYTRIVVPADQFRRVVWEARVFLVLLVGGVVAAVELGTIVPLLFVGLPSFYGAWFMWFCAITQHAGLREDVLDHRMSTRTVYVNPVFRFLYLNMNYHLEHHLFPAVPYYNLPALHEEIKAYLPPPKSSVLAAYREILTTIGRQRRDTSYELDRKWAPPIQTDKDPGAAARFTDERADGTIDLGPAGMLAPGEIVPIEMAGAPYVLCRLPEGRYVLADGTCTHGRARLAEGFLDDCVLECPKHNGRFDLNTGEAVRLPATKPLRRYALAEKDGRLVVQRSELGDAGAPAGKASPTGTANPPPPPASAR